MLSILISQAYTNWCFSTLIRAQKIRDLANPQDSVHKDDEQIIQVYDIQNGKIY